MCLSHCIIPKKRQKWRLQNNKVTQPSCHPYAIMEPLPLQKSQKTGENKTLEFQIKTFWKFITSNKNFCQNVHQRCLQDQGEFWAQDFQQSTTKSKILKIHRKRSINKSLNLPTIKKYETYKTGSNKDKHFGK